MSQLYRVESGLRRKATGAQGANLRGKGQRPVLTADVKRFDSETVAGQKQRSSLSVPDREREHSVQPLEAVDALFSVKTEHDLHVTPAAEATALRFQLPPQLAIVVDLTVEDDGQPLILEHDRLLPGLQVDHRQAPEAQRNVFVVEKALVVWTTVDEGAGHGGDPKPSPLRVPRPQNADNAAHLFSILPT